MPEASDMEVTKKVFDAMPQRTIIVWNSLISGYEQNGFPSDVGVGLPTRSNDNSELIIFPFSLWARDFGCWLHDYANLNVVLGASLINMYTRCGNVSKAREVFDSMKEIKECCYLGSHDFRVRNAWLCLVCMCSFRVD